LIRICITYQRIFRTMTMGVFVDWLANGKVGAELHVFICWSDRCPGSCFRLFGTVDDALAVQF
ncbi:MAG: hypothetical protein JAY73_16250, partial [Candidatus Thiodiazotropha taylori]|nr:hypothetical protein [Candidatus Thiodiazotropha taylori]